MNKLIQILMLTTLLLATIVSSGPAATKVSFPYTPAEVMMPSIKPCERLVTPWVVVPVCTTKV